jgi:hypothetical protein
MPGPTVTVRMKEKRVAGIYASGPPDCDLAAVDGAAAFSPPTCDGSGLEPFSVQRIATTIRSPGTPRSARLN